MKNGVSFGKKSTREKGASAFINHILKKLESFGYLCLFTALHIMQTRYSDENSVRLSVRLSHASIVIKRKKDLSRFLYHTKDNLA